MDDLGRDKKAGWAYILQKPVMKKRLFLACALALGLSACSQHQEQPVESGAPVKTSLSPVTAPGKKPDRPAVNAAPQVRAGAVREPVLQQHPTFPPAFRE